MWIRGSSSFFLSIYSNPINSTQLTKSILTNNPNPQVPSLPSLGPLCFPGVTHKDLSESAHSGRMPRKENKWRGRTYGWTHQQVPSVKGMTLPTNVAPERAILIVAAPGSIAYFFSKIHPEVWRAKSHVSSSILLLPQYLVETIV